MQRQGLDYHTQPRPPNNVIYQDVVREHGLDLWAGPDLVLGHFIDKDLPESKCRFGTAHPPQDRVLDWEVFETHLAEHCRNLNNTSSALRRKMAVDAERFIRDWLKIYFIQEDAPDFDPEDGSEMFEEQIWVDDVNLYVEVMDALRSQDIAGPLKEGKRPYDILEYVPPFERADVDSRVNLLRQDLVTELTRAQTQAPIGDETILGGRDRYAYDRNEQFADLTMSFIFDLLALDPGLSGGRMLEIGKLFRSVLLEPWYASYGHSDRQPGDQPADFERANIELRRAIIRLDDIADGLRIRQNVQSWTELWWKRVAYAAFVGTEFINHRFELSYRNVYSGSTNLWMTFYKNWLQVLANVELSHTKLTQEQLDDENEKNCPVCADDYDVSSPYDCPVYYGCRNSHTLCKKCYTSLSLTPNKPYSRLETDQFCPTCRAEIPYYQALSNNLLEDMQFMPMLQTVFTPDTVTGQTRAGQSTAGQGTAGPSTAGQSTAQ